MFWWLLTDMIRLLRNVIVCAVFAVVSPVASLAAGTGGCESFAWPLKTEIEWMQAADSQPAASGATLSAPPAKAISLALLPSESVKFALAPTGKPKGDAAKTFGGLVTFEGVPAAGLYQVSLSGPGWIDVIQDGKALETVAHTGKSDCEGLRKSLRFNIGAGPFVVQLNGVQSESVKLAVRAAN